MWCPAGAGEWRRRCLAAKMPPASAQLAAVTGVTHQLVKTTFSVFIRKLFVTKSHTTAPHSGVEYRSGKNWYEIWKFRNFWETRCFLITVSAPKPKRVEANQFFLLACCHAGLRRGDLALCPRLGYCSTPLPAIQSWTNQMTQSELIFNSRRGHGWVIWFVQLCRKKMKNNWFQPGKLEIQSTK